MSSGKKAVIAALSANFGIAVAKFGAALHTGSGAMFAEGVHSLADTMNQIFLLIGMKESQKPADADHPLGYGRVTYFWSMLVGMLLFLMGGLYSLYEGIHRLFHPGELNNVGIAVLVIVISMALEGKALMTAMDEIKQQLNGRSFFKWWRETRQSELLVIAGEDIGALLGLVSTLIMVGLTWLTGNPIFDAIGTISVGVILTVIAFMVIREVKAMVISESADPQLRDEIKKFIIARPEVDEVFEIITSMLGEKMWISVRAKMTERENACKLVDEINAVEDALKEKWPQIVKTFFEPDHK